MQLPALKNVPASLIDGMSIEDFIKNSTTNLQRIPTGGGGGTGIAGAVYLGFDGTTGQWKLNREKVEADDVGRILVPQHGLFEGYIEWANSSPLQKIQRPLLGVQHDEPMSERLLPKPLSPGAYKKETDGPSYQLGFVGFMLDDGATVVFEHSSMGAKKAINALATTATQAITAFGEIVHPVIELGSSSYENSYRTIHDPKFAVVGYITDKRAREVTVIADSDIITRPTATKGKLRRGGSEAPAI
jgi:hypothetical protein